MALWDDLRLAVRLLSRHRGFTCVAVLALALGIGVNNTFLTLVHAIVLRGPLADSTGIVVIGPQGPAGGPTPTSYAEFEALREGLPVMAGVAALSSAPAALGDDSRAAERVTAAYVSANAFGLIGESPVVGRGFSHDDDQPGAPAVAILATDLWQSRLAADPAIVGRSVRVDGEAVTIVGIMREGFRFPNEAGLWRPLASLPDLASARSLLVLGRLAEGATGPGAQAALDRVAADLSRRSASADSELRLTMVPIDEQMTPSITHPAWLAFITAGVLVLLIACANVANLMLARGQNRSGELALRLSLGASRARVVRQLLAESAVLAALGGVAGLLLSLAGLQLLSALVPEDALPSWMHFGMDAPVFGALAAACLGTAFIFGLVPALQSSNVSLEAALRGHGWRSPGARGSRRWTTTFLVAQFALTFVLTAALVDGIRARAQQDSRVAIEPAGLLTTFVTLSPRRYPTRDDRELFYDRLMGELQTLPDVASAALITALPLGGGAGQLLEIAGRELSGSDTPPQVLTLAADPGYFRVLGMGMVRGQAFGAEDGRPGRETAIVNQRLVRTFFADQDPLGQQLRLVPPGSGEPSEWLTVVGVSPDIRQGGGRDPDPVVYRPFRAVVPETAALIVKGRTASGVGAAVLRARVHALDPDLPLYRTRTMEQVVYESTWNGRVSNILVNTIVIIALLLAAVGLYAVTAHAFATRTREIGLRMALGARHRHVGWVVLRRSAFQLALGLTGGVLGAIAWEKLLSSEPGMAQPLVLVPAALAIALIACVACLSPVRRAMRVDPIQVLRHE